MTVFILLPLMLIHVGLTSHAMMITLIFMLFLSIQSGVLQSVLAKLYRRSADHRPSDSSGEPGEAQEILELPSKGLEKHAVQKRRAFSLDEKLLVADISLKYEFRDLHELIISRDLASQALIQDLKKGAARNRPTLAVMKTVHIDIPPTDEIASDTACSSFVDEIRVIGDKISLDRIPEVISVSSNDSAINVDFAYASEREDGVTVPEKTTNLSRRSYSQQDGSRWKACSNKSLSSCRKKLTIRPRRRSLQNVKSKRLISRRQNSVLCVSRSVTVSETFLYSGVIFASEGESQTSPDPQRESSLRSLLGQTSSPFSAPSLESSTKSLEDDEGPENSISSVLCDGEIGCREVSQADQDLGLDYIDLSIAEDWILIDRFQVLPKRICGLQGKSSPEETCPMIQAGVKEVAVQTDERDIRKVGGSNIRIQERLSEVAFRLVLELFQSLERLYFHCCRLGLHEKRKNIFPKITCERLRHCLAELVNP